MGRYLLGTWALPVKKMYPLVAGAGFVGWGQGWPPGTRRSTRGTPYVRPVPVLVACLEGPKTRLDQSFKH
jgi:hypothetical protein